MQKVADLVGTLMAQLPEAPEPIVTEAYVRAARTFCTDTRVWRAHNAYLIRIGEGRYLIEGASEADAEATDAVFVEYNGNRLEKQTHDQLARRSTSGRARYYRVSVGEVHVQPVPGEDDQLQGSFVMRPVRSAQSIDDSLADRFTEIFEDGAMARLLAYPKKAWTDTALATYYLTRFQDHIDEWRTRATDEGMVGVARAVRYGGY